MEMQENRHKTHFLHAYRYRFCIFNFILTFTMKHLTSAVFS